MSYLLRTVLRHYIQAGKMHLAGRLMDAIVERWTEVYYEDNAMTTLAVIGEELTKSLQRRHLP